MKKSAAGLACRHAGEVSPGSLASAAGEVARGMFTARPVMLATILFLTARQEDVAAWWVPVQAFALLFVAWIVFDRVLIPAKTMLRVSVTGGGDAAKMICSTRLKDGDQHR